MHNFREMAETFDAAAAWRRVGTPGSWAPSGGSGWTDPQAGRATGERARRLVEESRGALERTLKMLAEAGVA